MKKILMTALGALIFGSFTVRADSERAIAVADLPASAQTFIQKHFAGDTVLFAVEERDFLELRYEVTFRSMAKAEFYKDGSWKEVECRHTAVPAGIIPAEIAAKVMELYPQVAIYKIERDAHEYEVTLGNRLELTFDKRFNLIDIDD